MDHATEEKNPVDRERPDPASRTPLLPGDQSPLMSFSIFYRRKARYG